ncbi:phage major capsid protein, P2 family [Pandoraea nosoerga]|uniref:phage major capsid protein, P2 family n=1 Tax=Pandoraea nosoerga TaxID=2508296 RepID=UPI00197FCA64|nr:phage major capsid protein, P2 family [Pandoraea nosoerga]MBN4667216.1 phage major capsid protein, P2 family [Pandoraea nosoerga]MBN4677203.1 phage major capsid protein, P2 family [Pandoraea nosoerga]MBN4681975.1 phage major capsid protein, P2 family [Pandoraea nosoerga]MBN4746293.1 phage major capsid protein, P2 family [Pandoraea nosoerga]
MRKETRIAFNGYLRQLEKLNGVETAAEKFTVVPSVQQKLETKMQESAEFLKRINIVGVTEQQGEKLGLGVGSPLASTTNTDLKERETIDPTDLDPNGYVCTQTNFDSHLKYSKLDAWAKFPDFQTRVRDALLKRQALDRICIGFNGVSRAATSDRVANPLLQDVNKGWLQKYREQAPARVMDHGKTAGKVVIGAGGDYANLDAAVYDALSSLLDPWHQEDTDLVVLCGRALAHEKYFPLINRVQAPTEQLAGQIIMSQKAMGGRPAAMVPYFPANAFMITRLDNLSIYFQDGGRRRSVIDNPRRDRVENFESSNDAFVVEDYGLGCLVEHIEFVAE